LLLLLVSCYGKVVLPKASSYDLEIMSGLAAGFLSSSGLI
jgi:hypothetical protein